jgi:hypothetical protein
MPLPNGIAAISGPAYSRPIAERLPQCRSRQLPGPGIPDAAESQAADSIQGSPEVALNQKVKNLIQKLGEAVHESVSESENIAGVVKNIRDQGFDVLLMLEATIGLNEVEADAEETAGSAQEDPLGPFTRHDLTFLKSLRISLPEEDSPDIDIEPSSGSGSHPSASD